MHQNFLQFIDPDDSMGFRECIAKPKEAVSVCYFLAVRNWQGEECFHVLHVVLIKITFAIG
mgnify:CR=1 FL=1